jgi:hypothetical protein
MTAETERQEESFFERGCQYHVTGRFAFMAGLHPVAANLLHHAVEFVLKGALSKSQSMENLRKHLHRLPDVWNAFKTETGNTTPLARFDTVITTLHAHWDLRYPDDVLRHGMELITSTHRGSLPANFPFVSPGMLPADVTSEINKRLATLPKVKRYDELCLQDVDELIEAIFVTTKRNPRFLFNTMSATANDMLSDRNLAKGLLT